jgi:hypothetical protein
LSDSRKSDEYASQRGVTARHRPSLLLAAAEVRHHAVLRRSLILVESSSQRLTRLHLPPGDPHLVALGAEHLGVFFEFARHEKGANAHIDSKRLTDVHDRPWWQIANVVCTKGGTIHQQQLSDKRLHDAGRPVC